MGSKIVVPEAPTGLTLKAKIVGYSTGQVWNGSAMENYVTAHYSTYQITMTEQGTASGLYVGQFPTIIPAGDYSISVRKVVDGTEVNDVPVGVGDLVLWDGTNLGSLLTIMPVEAAGRPATILGTLRRAWEWCTNLVTRDRSTGVETLYGADNTTVLERRTQSTTGNVDQISKGA